jgi:CubicO group peptidase (beta-lactamase class C family)
VDRRLSTVDIPITQNIIQAKNPETMSYKTLITCLKSSPLLVFLLLLQPAKAQYNWTDLDKELTGSQKLLGENVVVMIWKSDSLVYKKEMGGFNSKTQAPIASCSKWLTAALMMQFVDEGKLSLDDKINKWLPEFEKYFKNYITVRQCLSHMTGISDEGILLKKILQRKRFSSLEEEVNYIASQKIRANPGSDFWYGNVGLNIAGRILEVISKKKFDQLIKQKLLTPLGMRKTTFSTMDASAVNPSGGAQSTADDYMKFLAMLLNNGKHNGQQILSEEAVKQMRQIQNGSVPIAYAPKAAQDFHYTLGSWVAGSSATDTKTATVLTSPGLFGTWPMIDYCRGYAYLVFVKSLLGEEKANAHMAIKEIVDKQIVNSCK